jgi:hypothetical protein
MARKSKSGEVNKSEAIRELLKTNPAIKASEVIETLSAKGIKVNPSLFYFIKGNVKGKKSRRKKAHRMVESVTATMGLNGATPTKSGDVVAIIIKLKHLAAEVGGLKKLKALVEVLSD